MGAAAFAAPAAVAGCRVALARGFAGAVTLLATAPDRTDVDPPLTASLCQVPTEAKVLSNVAEKYTRYTLPPPQKCPLVAQPLMVFFPTSTCASITPLMEPDTLTSRVACVVTG